MERQPQPRRDAQRPPRLVVEKRLGHGPLGELAVLQPAHEDGAEATRADVERVGEQHAVGVVALANLDGAECVEQRRRVAEQLRVERAQLARRRAQLRRDARLVAVLGGEHVSPARVRRGPRRVGLGDKRVEQLLRPGRRSGGEGVEPRQRPRRPLRGGLARTGDLVAPDPGVERIDGVGATALARFSGLAHTGRPQPREQVLGAAAGQRRPRARQHTGAEPRPRQRHPPRPRHRDPVGAQHLREQRRRPRAPYEHGDVLGGHPVAHQLEHLGADDLGLRALAARLEEAHGAVRRTPLGGGLEQPALEMVQRRPRGAGVVLGALGQLDDLPQRRELVDGRGAPGQRVAPRLVRERDPDIGFGQPRQRLDRVELRPRQLVEAVEEDRPPPPDCGVGAQRIQRRPRLALAVGALERLEPPAVGGVQRGQLVGVRHSAPRPQRAREARGLDQRPLQLGEQRARRPREPRRGRRRSEHAQPRVGDRGLNDALARHRAERPRANSGDPAELPHQPRERQHLGAEHHATGRELALVVGDVGGGRHHQQRLAVQDFPQSVEHVAGLGGVRGSGDEGERHADRSSWRDPPTAWTAPGA